MNNLVIMGMPAAGKGTVCGRLVKDLGFHHISTGNILREEQAAGTKLGLMADRIINSGGYMPDDIMIPLVKEHVIRSSNEVGFLFDGFPRTKQQAKQLHVFLFQRKMPLCGVIYLDVDKHIAVERILNRSKLEGRLDDTEEAISNRWGQYNAKTLPLIDFFSKKGLITRVSANPSPDEVYVGVKAAVDQWLNIPA